MDAQQTLSAAGAPAAQRSADGLAPAASSDALHQPALPQSTTPCELPLALGVCHLQHSPHEPGFIVRLALGVLLPWALANKELPANDRE